MQIKPGYRTSEFWFTLVSFIFSGLFLLGVVGDNQQKEELIRDVSHGVESIILIGGQILILWNYISSRKVAKQHAVKTKTNINIEEPPITEIADDHQRDTNSSPNKRRSNNNRSRKTNSKRKTKSQPSKKRSSS